MLNEKDDKIQTQSMRVEMLVEEVGKGRLIIGQQGERLKTLHKTIR